LCRHQQQRPIAPPGAGGLVGSCQESLNLASRQEINWLGSPPFAGNGQDPLGQSAQARFLKGDIPEKRVNGSQANVATGGTVVSVFLQVAQERADERRIQILRRQQRRRFAETHLSKSQEQSKRVAVAGNRMRAGVEFSHQPLGEVTLK
jgi:hypothetical protein